MCLRKKNYHTHNFNRNGEMGKEKGSGTCLPCHGAGRTGAVQLDVPHVCRVQPPTRQGGTDDRPLGGAVGTSYKKGQKHPGYKKSMIEEAGRALSLGGRSGFGVDAR